MQPTLVCRNGCEDGFVSITNDFTQLKGRKNEGMMEMETWGDCARCGRTAYSSLIGPIDSFTLETKAGGR